MSLIVKKVIRSMWSAKRTYFACICVITVGIMCYVSLAAVYESLVASRDKFYNESNFADVFAQVKQMPAGVLNELMDIDGVDTADGRISLTARALTGDSDKIITLRLLGYDEAQVLNAFTVYGSPLTDSKDILPGKPFMEAHGLKEGDAIELAVYGGRMTFTVRGSVQSPEYVYVMPENGSMMPDPYSYDVAVVMNDVLENASGMKGMVTDISLTLSEGWAYGDIKSRITELLMPYGLVYMYERKNQPSNLMLTQELDSLNGMSTQMSGLFIFVAAAILYIMLRRLVEQERTQIGVLKAFGYTDARILTSYALYGAITGLIGGILGSTLGAVLGGSLFNLYLQYFNMPAMVMKSGYGYYAAGVIIALSVGVVAALFGVKGVLKLKPADSMRPSAPPIIRRSAFDFALLSLFLTKRGIMSLRFIERSKFKSILIVFSISLSFMLMAVMFSFNDLIDKMMLNQFTKAETYDLKVMLKQLKHKTDVISGIRRLTGVEYAEAVLETPVSASHENITVNSVVHGLTPKSPLYKIMDEDEEYYTPPTDGVIVTKMLADKLFLKQGDLITLDSPGLKEKINVRVLRIIATSFGSGFYMDIDALGTLFYGTSVANAVVIAAEDGKSTDLMQALIKGDNISGITDSKSVLQTYNDYLETYVYMVASILVMAVLIAFAVIYNISGVSLSERQRELATMRLLGYTSKEAAEILAFENYVLCTAAILAGIPLTIFAMKAMATTYNNEVYAMPSKLPFICCVYAALCCVFSVFLSNQALHRGIKRFDLVEVLKERD